MMEFNKIQREGGVTPKIAKETSKNYRRIVDFGHNKEVRGLKDKAIDLRIEIDRLNEKHLKMKLSKEEFNSIEKEIESKQKELNTIIGKILSLPGEGENVAKKSKDLENLTSLENQQN